MAEALGTVASVLQLASAVKEICKFYQAVRNAPIEIIRLRKSLDDLEKLLLLIDSAFPKSSTAYPPELESTLRAINRDINELSTTKSLSDKQKAKRDRIVDRLRWVVGDKNDAINLTRSVEQHKTSLVIILQIITR